ncbi:hypothetical protein PM10SUCC1_32710 [Propionigenium maris DSM 9537]|uniref:Initiator Rep protein WH1 domain-containing protein n=1 Tax=Propionigenium maris DSM 9537 TaxID=1123000 RepID=A0A9W6GNQ1_9FUSO|nr:replication initiation protein [Propionigenium maris]GLI57757.1 hypothetical protein PM10SUCC1_32710 [Propionigenium maris DSM 9537]
MNKNVEISRDITNGVFGNTNSKFLKRDKWSPNEIKLFLNLIFRLQENKSLNVELTPGDLYPNLSNSNRFDYLNKILNGIKSKSFFMKIDDDKYRNYSLFSYLEYNNAREDIIVQFNKDLQEQLFNMRSFSKIDLDELMKLDSYFAIRARLLLSAFNHRKDFILDIERFKILFQIPETYKNSHIEKKVFEFIKKECPEVKEINFKKSGRKATHVIFKYDFKLLKAKAAKSEDAYRLPDGILIAIEKAKRNRFILEAWNPKVDAWIIKKVDSEGEEVVKKILRIAYKGLLTPIKSNLVAYLNKILENLEAEEEKKPAPPKPPQVAEKPVEGPPEEKVEVVETPELLKKAEELYLKDTNTKAFNPVHRKIFNSMKVQYLLKASLEK